MKRIYQTLIEEHLASYPQMIFLMGACQVGKKTLVKRTLAGGWCCLSWDDDRDRQRLMQPQQVLGQTLGLDQAHDRKLTLVFDEIHKNERWKNWLKGFYDRYREACQILVTGSARMDVYQRGGDSLVGRYLSYRIHPFSVAECVQTSWHEGWLREPSAKAAEVCEPLLRFGGFPDPFLRQEERFHRRWQSARLQLLLREDVRDLTKIQSLARLEQLVSLLPYHCGQLLSVRSLAQHLAVAHTTAQTWLELLERLYVCYTIKPWASSVQRALRRQPKLYLWDWSQVAPLGGRIENLVASHLCKAVHFWEDAGLGACGVHFVRDKEGREVDFLLTRDQKPWCLVEVKASGKAGLSPHLFRFQKALGCPHALQVAWDLPYQAIDCWSLKEPKIVPASTFLSQLI